MLKRSDEFAHIAFSGAVVTDMAAVQPIGHSRPSPHVRAAIQPHAALVCRLNGLRLPNPCKYMDYGEFTWITGVHGMPTMHPCDENA